MIKTTLFNDLFKLSLLFWLVSIGLNAEPASDELNLYIGEVKILQVGDIERVAVGSSTVLSTSMLENGQLLLLAEGAGRTAVHVWFANGTEAHYTVNVSDADQSQTINELEQLVRSIGEIEVKRVGGKIFLTGILEKSHEESLKTVLKTYPEVLDLTNKIDSPAAPISLPDDKMVYMDVKFTELRKNFDENLGISWDQLISGPVAAINYDAESNTTFRATDPNNAPAFAATLPNVNAGPLGFFSLTTQISSAINLLVSSGNAIILAEPRLSARSGGKAEFLAGGEIPIVIATANSTDVEYKEFGIKLEIEPIIDIDNNIVAKIMTESSTIDPDRPGGGNTPPGFITRRTSTDVRMKDQETLVISGLLDKRLNENVRKLPLLGDIPVLGAFFRSTLVDDTDNELVIFVTPKVYDANSQFNKNAVKRSDELVEKYKELVGRDDLIID